MKYYYEKIFMFFILALFLVCSSNVYAELPLLGKTIVVDAGHGRYSYTKTNKIGMLGLNSTIKKRFD